MWIDGPPWKRQGNALRGSWMVSQNQQKIWEANGMPSLPTGPTQVTKTGNVGSLDALRTAHLFTFGPRGRVMHWRIVNGLKISAQNRRSQFYAQSAYWGHTKLNQSLSPCIMCTEALTELWQIEKSSIFSVSTQILTKLHIFEIGLHEFFQMTSLLAKKFQLLPKLWQKTLFLANRKDTVGGRVMHWGSWMA